MRYSLLALTLAACAVQAAPVTELDTLVVTATRSLHDQAAAPASVSVITAEQIKASGASNLLEAVRSVPGLTLKGRQVGGRKTLSIRGAEDRHTLVLVDGRRISSTDDTIGHSDYQYGWVALDQIERIEVVRGPMSALYGSEAVGGVINIITKKGSKAWHGSAFIRSDDGAGSGGDGSLLSGSLRGALNSQFDIAVNVENLQRTPTASEIDPNTSAIEGTRRHSGNLQLGFEPVQGQRLQLDALNSDETRTRNEQYAYGARPYYRDTYELQRRNRALTWQGDWSFLQSELRYSESEFSVTNRRTQNISPTRPQDLNDKTWDGHLSFGLGARNALVLGAEHREETLKNAGLIGGSDTATHRAIYAQDEITLADDWMLTLGARLDRHEIFGNETSPRAYLVWQALPELVIKGGYGEAFRAPTLKQISPNYVGAEGPHTFLGNADIKPETSQSVELAAEWSGESGNYSLTLFRNKVDDLIYYRLEQQIGPRRIYRYDNMEHAQIDGVEIFMSQALGAGFSFSTSLTWLDARDADTDQHLTGRAEWIATPTLKWQQGDYSAQLEWQYTGKQWLTNDSQQLEQAPAYSLVNLSGRYRWNDNLSIRGGINNLNDVQLPKKSDLFGYEEERRTLWLGLEAGF